VALYKRNPLSWAWWFNTTIPGIQEVEIWRITVQDQLGQKVLKNSSQSIKAGCGCVHLSSSYQRNGNKRIMVQASQGIH
jgi:hypothetical protein